MYKVHVKNTHCRKSQNIREGVKNFRYSPQACARFLAILGAYGQLRGSSLTRPLWSKVLGG